MYQPHKALFTLFTVLIGDERHFSVVEVFLVQSLAKHCSQQTVPKSGVGTNQL